jgi:ADP-ribosylglycohydrolase
MTRNVRAVVHGLSVADGLAWQNLYRRSRLLAPWTRRKRREVEAEHEAYGILDEALPFALNQPTEPFLGAPGAHTEWLCFQLEVLRAGQGRYDREVAVDAWHDLGRRRDDVRLTVGQHAAVNNLGAGLAPPVSGHDNPHYFDDAAVFRAVALLLVPDGDVAIHVRRDAEISNAHDGIWAAEASVATLAAALDGSDARTAISRGQQTIPGGSWLALEVRTALASAGDAPSLFGLIDMLGDRAVNHAYDYGNSAPETLAIAWAIVHHTGGALEPSLLAALALPKSAASVAPMVGALCGALGTTGGSGLHDPGPLRGVALPQFAGRRPLQLFDEVVALAT